jgi:hypothetical protein
MVRSRRIRHSNMPGLRHRDLECAIMNRRTLLAAAAICAMAAGTAVDARVADGASTATQLLARDWRHVGTADAATGADLASRLPQLVAGMSYRADGSYVSGEHDRGTWSLSADGRTITLSSATFEYGIELSVERLDAGMLRITSRQSMGPGGEVRAVAETFAPAGRQVITAR